MPQDIALDVRKVINPEGVTGYLTAALRAGVWACRETLQSDLAVSVHGYDPLPVEMEAPIAVQSYPYVQVMYRNKSFQPASLQEARLVQWSDVDGTPFEGKLHAYLFDGSYSINVYANTILERERLCDCVIGLVGVDDSFPLKLVENPWINIAPNMATMASPTASESWGTPWDSDVMTAFRQLTFDVRGEFYYIVGRQAEYLSRIDIEARLKEARPTR